MTLTIEQLLNQTEYGAQQKYWNDEAMAFTKCLYPDCKVTNEECDNLADFPFCCIHFFDFTDDVIIHGDEFLKGCRCGGCIKEEKRPKPIPLTQFIKHVVNVHRIIK